jgi:hypothetical protein
MHHACGFYVPRRGTRPRPCTGAPSAKARGRGQPWAVNAAPARLLGGVGAQTFKELASTLGVLPLLPIQAIVEAAGLGRQPDFMQWLLLVDDNLAAIGEHQCHHAAHALGIEVGIGGVVDAVCSTAPPPATAVPRGPEFKVSHYNSHMLKASQILIRTLSLPPVRQPCGAAASVARCICRPIRRRAACHPARNPESDGRHPGKPAGQ